MDSVSFNRLHLCLGDALPDDLKASAPFLRLIDLNGDGVAELVCSGPNGPTVTCGGGGEGDNTMVWWLGGRSPIQVFSRFAMIHQVTRATPQHGAEIVLYKGSALLSAGGHGFTFSDTQRGEWVTRGSYAIPSAAPNSRDFDQSKRWHASGS